ncbi:alpha/beta fold hydrolase [Microbacterium hominis]|uniref:alpha/beta fold hydrolase n=1 Tax=Microbacterium TaxID=33882 RepID=UPI00168ACB5D|nr:MULTISPECIES: alpha/beta fold hydrolase [Microbacterium]QOC24460.1 alpha/beta fold hydrolase [Microbacterium hominis]QOC28534.1 alpha/beta fold hydrolase [Microbacterium hominis]QYF96259.1 alpha/beta hydrolase [Microbacterium sp. PAMC21962]
MPLDDAAPETPADAVDAVVDAVDRAIDEITGVPTDDGRIEVFADAGASLIAERRGDPQAELTVVLIHGIGMGRKVFGDLVLHLQDHALVVAVDLPGYGDAPEPPRTPTMERMADLVAAYLRHLDRGPVVLLGHSMGTQVATEVAVRHPETVGRLVLVAPTVDRHHRRALRQLWRLGRDLWGESPKVLLLGAREYVRAGPHLRRKMRAMLAHRPEHAFPRIAAPTLVVRGEFDVVVPAPWFDEVVAAIPDARPFVIEGHRHETLIRTAEPAASELRRWLSQD